MDKRTRISRLVGYAVFNQDSFGAIPIEKKTIKLTRPRKHNVCLMCGKKARIRFCRPCSADRMEELNRVRQHSFSKPGR